MSIRREIAKICKIKDILKGRYIKREGWEPNYFETEYGKISRVNIMGFIVLKDEQGLVLDDGTGTISLRTFEEVKEYKEEVGDLALVIGKPRSFNEQTFIVSEIIKIITNPNWMLYRKKELELRTKIQIKEETTTEEKIETSKVDNLVDNIIKRIIELDQGDGSRISEVIEGFELVQANKTINELIEQGEIFELKPGIVKVI